MEDMETFYKHKMNCADPALAKDMGHFNVFRYEDIMMPNSAPIHYARRDFYKISLIRGEHLYHYADKSLKTQGTTLIFFNPQVPYIYEPLSGETTGYFCIFRENFFTEHLRGGIKDLPMFVPGNAPSYSFDEGQDRHATAIFEKMWEEIGSDYRYKYDLIRNYILELVHFALKSHPTQALYEHTDANARLTAVFTELLERQFPIESPSQRFSMRSASNFADKLAVHVNHLNRVLRTTTGKTTSAHIFERLTNEAKMLLRHTDWNIADISYSLGFEDPAHFNNFFKKHTALTPSSFRDQ